MNMQSESQRNEGRYTFQWKEEWTEVEDMVTRSKQMPDILEELGRKTWWRQKSRMRMGYQAKVPEDVETEQTFMFHTDRTLWSKTSSKSVLDAKKGITACQIS